MKTVVQYSFGFGDNADVHDKTTNTISGYVSMMYIFIYKIPTILCTSRYGGYVVLCWTTLFKKRISSTVIVLGT